MWRLLVVCLLVLGVAAALSDAFDASKRNSSNFEALTSPDRICPEGQILVRKICRKIV